MMEEDNKPSREDLKQQEELQEAAEKIISGEFSIQEYLGMSGSTLEIIYSIGVEMHKLKQYEKAKNVFKLLCMIKGEDPKYLAACGSAHFMLKEYVDALALFKLAVLAGDYTPRSLMNVALDWGMSMVH